MAWCVEIFTDGTHIVVDRLAGREQPFYRVFGPGGEGNDSLDDRHTMACELRDYLQGGPATLWLALLERDTLHPRTVLRGLRNSSVQAVGPYVEIYEEPKSRCVQSMTDDAFARRHELIDRLVQ